MDLGEFDLIEAIKERFPVPAGVTGIGDDCAIMPQHDGRETLVTTDMLMEGVHFLIEDVHPYDLGWKSAAVNLSDIAGMGGTPEATFLSFALPKALSDSWIKEFMDGYKAVSDLSHTPLLGGDTTSSLDRLCINVAVLGSCPAGASRKRSAALPGDLICCTGPLGDSGAGLKVILGGVARGKDEQTLIDRHYRPMPRVSEGLVLSATPGVHAMMDISDGIGSDLRHILDASKVGATVDTSAIPMSPEMLKVTSDQGWDALDCAINGGEDYELLFTITPEAEKALTLKHYVIGQIESDPGKLVWKGSDEDFHGFHHF